MNGVLLRNGRGRIRCWWYRTNSGECTTEGWAMFWEYLMDTYGQVPVCYNHSHEPRKAHILDLRKRWEALKATEVEE